jgi:citrate lyase alpha subunit
MSRGLFRVMVTVEFVNGAKASASIDEQNLVTIREVEAVFQRAKVMAEAMRPSHEIPAAASGWRPHVVNE